MNSKEDNKQYKIEGQQSDRNSSKSCSTVPEIDFSSPVSESFLPVCPHQFRFQLFDESPQGVEITQKMNQKVVCWMITLCWQKNLSQQCLWSTLLLYYTCKAKRKVKRQNLELTLLTCLCLSLKMTASNYYQPRQLAALSNQPLTATDIIKMEETILQLVDYNLVIPHQLGELLHQNPFAEDQLQTVLMVCELLMVKDYSIFMNRAKLEGIEQLLGRGQVEEHSDKDLFQQIKDLLKLKQCRIILNKYSSKFDTESFEAKFL